MTNQFPSFEGNQPPRNPIERYTDFIADSGWQEFLEVAKEIDAELLNFNEEDSDSEATLDEYAERIAEYFGVDYDDQKAIVRGKADVVDLDNNIVDLPRFLHEDDDLIFDGVMPHPINGHWQVRLAFHPAVQDNQTQPQNFYILPDDLHLSKLHILQKTEKEMNANRYHDALTKFVSQSTRMVDVTSTDEFLTLPIQKQHEFLNTATMRMATTLLPHYDGEYAKVECTQFYAIPDIMIDMNLPISDFFVDQDKLDSDLENYHWFFPGGMLLGCSYLEQDLDRNRHFTKPADFNLGFGAPCLTMYSYEDKCKYYILSQTITDIDKA